MTKTTKAKRVNYLSNKELLIEIHKSKLTFCEFSSEEHDESFKYYDIIVRDLKEIDDDTIADAKKRKADRDYKKKRQELLDMGFKSHEIKLKNEGPESVKTDDLVFRLMTFDHIPPIEDEEKLKKAKKEADRYEKCNYPPFKHYVLRDGEPVEVLRSHTKDGEFCTEHGRQTDRLAFMFMKLVEKYSQRGNWRGYCVDDKTEALTQRGWLGIDDITTDDIILSYDNGDLKWSKIKSIFRDGFDGNMFHLTVRGMDAFVTPGHKFITDKGLVPVEYLCEKDRVILSGNGVSDVTEIKYDDAFVELVGWTVTEGNYYKSDDRNYTRVTLYQNEGENANSIRECISKMGSTHGETIKENHSNIAFSLPKQLSEKLVEVAPNKVLNMDFINSLTQDQKELLIDTMIAGDGWVDGDKKRYCQKDKKHVDAFVALCSIAGYRTTCTKRDIVSYGVETSVYTVVILSKRNHVSRVENIDFHGGKRSGKQKGLGKVTHPNEPTVPYKGDVWCPETEYGSFMCRRNGKVYLTGNTYIDEMRSQALLQLAQIGLQFDESRSDTPNPFAYYTAAITNSFTRVLNVEKKNQHIRDDMLEALGHNPSFSRQIDHEYRMREVETKYST